MEAPQAAQPPDRPAHVFSEADFSQMVMGALQKNQVCEAAIDELLQRVQPGNGRSGLIVNPGGAPVRLNMPSAQDLAFTCLQGIRILLQTHRITLLALNDMDSRLRQQQAGTTNHRPDKQDQTDPAEPLAQGGSQSPEAAAQ